MRITGGDKKGRILRAPKGARTRPTTDRAKEAIFQILNSTLLDSTVLDLFAGSGALGLEALSRGAKHATFVENNRGAAEVITNNIEVLQLQEQSTVRCLSVATYFKNAPTFDVILADPPYQETNHASLFANVALCLNPSGVFVLEHFKKNEPQTDLLQKKDLRVYGDSAFSFYVQRKL